MKKPPLHVHLLFHPDSQAARDLAESFAVDWMGVPALQGLRVPVFFTAEDGSRRPLAVDVDAAEHSVIVLLVDSHMSNRALGEGEAWAAFARELCAAHPPGGQHIAFPVALDDSAFEFDESLGRRHFLTLRRKEPGQQLARLSFTIGVRALQLLGNSEASPLADRVEAPIQVFASHAKRDLDENREDPVGWVYNALDELPIRQWFDAREIMEGEEFEAKIRHGLESSDAVLVFLTDSWATRSWCRWEALIAKELGAPIVVIDALTEGEPRSFPYGGNARLLRWQPPVKPPTNDDQLRDWQTRSKIEGERMISAAVREALRLRHAQRRLEGLAEDNDRVLDVAPEAARLSFGPREATFLYPDPPIGREESDLLARIWPKIRFETPMMRLAQRAPLAAGRGLAVSVSESPDLARLGLGPKHQRLVTDELHLYLMLAGFQIYYGGKLEPEKLRDPDNFTLRLFQLARDYSDLARSAGADLAPIHNAAPWPLWTLYDHRVGKLFGRIAKLEKVPRPDFGLTDAELGANEKGFVPPIGPLQLYAWARALTAMREKVTADTVARICIGGRIEGYKGRLAGLIEEPLLSLRAQKPLFLVGALGGCTRLVIDLLEGRERPEMSEAVAEKEVKHHREILALYDERGGEKVNRDAIASELQDLGRGGPAAALRNGLDDQENRELFDISDPLRIATLVLTGLERLGPED